MSRRGEYKWAPFQSLFNTNKVLEEIKTQKKIHPKPILSEDEINLLEKALICAYHTKAKVIINNYYKGLQYNKTSIIINITNNKIYFQDKTSLYFEQILKITIV